MRFFIALFLLLVAGFIGVQAYNLYFQEIELLAKKGDLDAQASALILENSVFGKDIEYFKNDVNLTKELQTKVNYRKPDEKMFMLLPASPPSPGKPSE